MYNASMIQVNGVYVKTPSSMSIGYQDVSNTDAGRTQDALMHKNMITRKVKIELVWAAPTPEEAHAILTAFAPEYIQFTYYDPLEADTVTKTFYSGDKSAPIKLWTVGHKRYSQISFNIIER